MIDYDSTVRMCGFELHQLYVDQQIVVLSVEWNVETSLTRDVVGGALHLEVGKERPEGCLYICVRFCELTSIYCGTRCG